MYSLEFFQRTKQSNKQQLGSSIGEYFFLIGPVEYAEQFKVRVTTEPTFGGNAVVDFGNDATSIMLSGEIYMPYKARPPSKDSGYGIGSAFKDVAKGDFGSLGQGALGAAKSLGQSVLDSVAPLVALGLRNGKMEFDALMALLFYVREFDQIDVADGFDEAASSILKSFQSAKDARFSDYGMVFHDYSRNRHVEVVPSPNGVKVSRSTKDTNTYIWQVEFIGISNQAKKIQLSTPDLISELLGLNPLQAISRGIDTIQSIMNLPLILTGKYFQLSQAAKRFSEAGRELVDSWDRVRDQMNRDGKMASANFGSFSDNMKRALGQKPKKHFYDLLLDQADSNEKLIKEQAAARAEFERTVEEMIGSAYSFLVAIGAIALPGVDIEAEAGQPDADFTEWFFDPFYNSVMDTYEEAQNIQAEFRKSLIDNQYRVYRTFGGDDWESVAERFLSDKSEAAALAAYNGSTIETGIAGKPIKLPFAQAIATWGQPPDPLSSQGLEIGILGEDLQLTEARDFAISPTGDLAIISGEVAVSNNVIDLVDTPQGSLPQYPNWGNPAHIGEIPAYWEKERYVQRLIDSIQADPRVSFVGITERIQKGGNIRMKIEVKTIYDGEPNFYIL